MLVLSAKTKINIEPLASTSLTNTVKRFQEMEVSFENKINQSSEFKAYCDALLEISDFEELKISILGGISSYYSIALREVIIANPRFYMTALKVLPNGKRSLTNVIDYGGYFNNKEFIFNQKLKSKNSKMLKYGVAKEKLINFFESSISALHSEDNQKEILKLHLKLQKRQDYLLCNLKANFNEKFQNKIFKSLAKNFYLDEEDYIPHVDIRINTEGVLRILFRVKHFDEEWMNRDSIIPMACFDISLLSNEQEYSTGIIDSVELLKDEIKVKRFLNGTLRKNLSAIIEESISGLGDE